MLSPHRLQAPASSTEPPSAFNVYNLGVQQLDAGTAEETRVWPISLSAFRPIFSFISQKFNYLKHLVQRTISGSAKITPSTSISFMILRCRNSRPGTAHCQTLHHLPLQLPDTNDVMTSFVADAIAPFWTAIEPQPWPRSSCQPYELQTLCHVHSWPLASATSIVAVHDVDRVFSVFISARSFSVSVESSPYSISSWTPRTWTKTFVRLLAKCVASSSV